MSRLSLYQCHKKVRAAKITGIKWHVEREGKISANGPAELVLHGKITVEVDEAWLNRNPAVAAGGYFVEYQEGDKYTAYSPAAPFESGYNAVGNLLSFSGALDALKAGAKVSRSGWNGKGMWLALSPGSLGCPASNIWCSHNKEFAEQNGGNVDVTPYITMKTAAGKIASGWAPSQEDMLAEDWAIL